MSIKRSILAALFAIGCSLVFLACCLGITALINITTTVGASSAAILGCGLIVVLFYPLSIIMGVIGPLGACHISDHDARLNWLLMLLNAGAIFCLGHLILTGHADVISAGFLRPVYALLPPHTFAATACAVMFTA